MAGIEQRASVRVACNLPLRLMSDLQMVSATVLDISRRGVRVRLPGRQLGVGRMSTLVDVAQRISAVLGHAFVVELQREGGEPVRRTLEPIRIAQRDGSTADIDLGCRITEPLSGADAAVLGVELPEDGGVVQLACFHDVHMKPKETPPPLDDVPGLAAFVHADAIKSRPPFATAAEFVNADSAILRVADVGRLDLLRDVSDVSTLVIALDAAYGSKVAVELRNDGKHVWTGSARIRSVEFVKGRPRQALLGVGFSKGSGPTDLLGSNGD